MEHTHTHSDDIEIPEIPEWIVGVAIGISQANVERLAASYGIPARSITSRLAEILHASPSGPIMGANGSLPAVRSSPAPRGSLRSSAVALAGQPHRTVRRITKDSNPNGQLEKGAITGIVLNALRKEGTTERRPFLHKLTDDTSLKQSAIQMAIQRAISTGLIRKMKSGKISLTAAGSTRVDTPETAATETVTPDTPTPGKRGRGTGGLSSKGRASISKMMKDRWAKARKNGLSITGKKLAGTTSVLTPTGRMPKGLMLSWIAQIIRRSPTLLRPKELAQQVASEHPEVKEMTVNSAISRFYEQGVLKHTAQGIKLTAKGERDSNGRTQAAAA